MGRKVSPISLRIGITKTWGSNWFSAKKNYPELLHEDIKLRDFINKKMPNAGIADIRIERSQNAVNITIFTSKPGVVIGRKGSGIEDLRFELEKITKGKTIHLNIEEIRDPDLNAFLVASNIANQLAKRISYRRAAKQALSRTMEAGAQGIKVKISGRLGGAEIARRETFNAGKMPLHTFRSNVDYAYVPSHTTYGVIGVKVWIYKGEIFEDKTKKENTNSDWESLNAHA